MSTRFLTHVAVVLVFGVYFCRSVYFCPSVYVCHRFAHSFSDLCSDFGRYFYGKRLQICMKKESTAAPARAKIVFGIS